MYNITLELKKHLIELNKKTFILPNEKCNVP